MFETIETLISDLKLNVVESVSLDRRRQSRARIPDTYLDRHLAPVIADEAVNGRLWKHQARALRHLDGGRNVVISTGTASGKSLIFQLHALHRLLTEPRSKVLVLYPLRALASDQLVSWQNRAELAGLKPEEVAYITSDTKAIAYRDRPNVIERARIVIMTPDLCHRWLMGNIKNPKISQFLKELSVLVVDEAHVYESVFGSNVAFLIRRMLTAKRRLAAQDKLQVIAATATIDEPAKHLEQLTGLKFRVVDEDDNGAPTRQRRILHIEGEERGADGENSMANLIHRICEIRKRKRFIVFMDSRQGVERIVERVNTQDVKPYRSGYEPKDREEIETALRDGMLRGVVSTSALELGIDIPDLEIGVTLGVPQSRKQFRQRLGRVGRDSPGVFMVVAPRNAFKQYGETLSDYYDSSVEPSYLYLDNRFIQFANARCLKDEMDGLNWNSSRPAGWAADFRDKLKLVRDGIWPSEYNNIDARGSDSPHHNYPLRQFGEKNIRFQRGTSESADSFGEISHQQAIREAFPGAYYIHNTKRYKVVKWRESFDAINICLQFTKDRRHVFPVPWNSFVVNVPDGIVGGRIKRGNSGFIAEAEIHVNESVEGYRLSGNTYRYKDLQAKDRNMKPQRRRFDTTGVVVKIEEDWFKSQAVKGEVARGLYDLLCRDKSIAPHDIDTSHANVRIGRGTQLQPANDAIIIYDSVYGGLRLTESLFYEIDGYMEQLRRAVEIAGEDAKVSEDTLDSLQAWLGALHSSDAAVVVDSDWLSVYRPGCVVSTSKNYLAGDTEYEIIRPEYDDRFGIGNPQLIYICKSIAQPSQLEAINHESIDPFGRNSEMVLWNPDTGEYRELEDG